MNALSVINVNAVRFCFLVVFFFAFLGCGDGMEGRDGDGREGWRWDGMGWRGRKAEKGMNRERRRSPPHVHGLNQ